MYVLLKHFDTFAMGNIMNGSKFFGYACLSVNSEMVF
jgi:hypothetical protein